MATNTMLRDGKKQVDNVQDGQCKHRDRNSKKESKRNAQNQNHSNKNEDCI